MTGFLALSVFEHTSDIYIFYYFAQPSNSIVSQQARFLNGNIIFFFLYCKAITNNVMCVLRDLLHDSYACVIYLACVMNKKKSCGRVSCAFSPRNQNCSFKFFLLSNFFFTQSLPTRSFF